MVCLLRLEEGTSLQQPIKVLRRHLPTLRPAGDPLMPYFMHFKTKYRQSTLITVNAIILVMARELVAKLLMGTALPDPPY